jgi:Kef-type K+ transport system membrane component KefB
MTPGVSLSSLFAVAAVAFAMPLLLGLAPRVRVPAVVLEIVAGIVVGPSVLGWVELETPIQVLALIGLAFTLFLAGLEIDFERLRGPILRLAGGGFVASFGLALVAGVVLAAAGQVDSALFLAIVLAATSLGVVIPVLKDSGQVGSDLGQLLIVAASIADFGTIILLTLFFSGEATRTSSQVVLIGALALLAVAAATVLLRVERSPRLAMVFLRLQDTTAQIRVRGAFLLLTIFVALAERLGLEVILGAFIAGAILKLVDRDEMGTHRELRRELDAMGFGVFIPFFFVVSGIRFDLNALFASASTVARVPVFLVALLLVRGVPAWLYRNLVGTRHAVAAGFLQATSLGFVVVASQIGQDLGQIDAGTGAALIAAALLSVLLFPLAALTLLGGKSSSEEPLSPASLGAAMIDAMPVAEAR